MERFGLILLSKDYDSLVRDILNKINEPVYIEDNGFTFHKIIVEGQELYALFNTDYGCLVTAYRKSWFKELPDGTLEKKNKKTLKKSIRYHNRKLTLDSKLGVI